jgi:Aspartyl/Asparaginyl beta-hydroxylase
MRRFSHYYPWQIVTKLTDTSMTCRLREDVELDTERLCDEARDVIAEYAPSTHFEKSHHDGGWNAVGLVAPDGDPHDPKPGSNYQKTPALSLAPYMESVIDSFEADKRRVRLMRLEPGKSVYWHFDPQSIDDGLEARFHIPIVTNESVRCQISHEDVRWRAGEIWYGDFSFPHRLCNGGREDRIHLVFDLRVDENVLGLIPKEFREQRAKRARVRKLCHSTYDLYRLPRRFRRVYERDGLSGIISRGRKLIGA